MRSSEAMAYALYLADYQETDPRLGRPLLEWEEIEEGERQTYLRHAEASLRHLFEHARIIAYIPTTRKYQELSDQHREYVAAKIRDALSVSPSDLGKMTDQ